MTGTRGKGAPDTGSNHVGFRSKEADDLMKEGRTTIDPEKRIAIWHKFQEIVYDEQPYTWLYSEVDCAFINGRLSTTARMETPLWKPNAPARDIPASISGARQRSSIQ